MADWIPTNKGTVRICAMLVQAHRAELIKMGWADFTRCKEALFCSRFHFNVRRKIGALWLAHRSREILKRQQASKPMAPEILDELSA